MAAGETFHELELQRSRLQTGRKAGNSAFRVSSSRRRGVRPEVPCGRAGLWPRAALPSPRTQDMKSEPLKD